MVSNIISTMSVIHQAEASQGPKSPSKDTDSGLKTMLDQIDNVRQALSGLKSAEGNQIFYEELLASLPQFVACGPQSAGKSSVIRRISGVSLPEASTLCTRIATVIQMRREQQVSVEVHLKGPDEDALWCEKVGFEEMNKVPELVKKAQDEALSKCTEASQFVDNHTVLITVQGPDRQNLTLVDLPGFHNSSDADSKTVNDLVKRYIGMPGTLAMHVVKGDQDYDSILGNDFMRSDKVDRVTVLTHCDKIDNSTECTTRLQETLRKASETSSMTFAVHGSSKNQDEEDSTLTHMQVFCCENFDVGATSLAGHLEQRMKAHLETQLPLTLAKMQASLDDTSSSLKSMKRKHPGQHIAILCQTIRQNFAAKKEGIMNEIREEVHCMAREIRQFCLKPQAGECFFEDCDAFEGDWEPGMEVLITGWLDQGSPGVTYVDPDDENTTTKVSITEVVSDEEFKWAKLPDSHKSTPETGRSHIDEACSIEIAGAEAVIQEIQQMTNKRGLRNMMHTDRQPIIEVYAKQFAAHYTAILIKRGALILSRVKRALDFAFSTDVDPAAAGVARQLRAEMAELEGKAREDMTAAIRKIEEHNANSDLIFTTNEHYLNSLVQRMVAADKKMASDVGSARHIYHNVRAFLKVQRKQISELAAKELTRTAVLEVEASLNRLLVADMTDFHEQLAAEPDTVQRKRAKLEARHTVLQQALAILPSRQLSHRVRRRV